MIKNLDPMKLELINHVDAPLLVSAASGAGNTMAGVVPMAKVIGA